MMAGERVPILGAEGLVDTAQIAQMLGVTREHVTDRLTKRPGFPAPVVDVSQRTRRWSREQVRVWVAQDERPATEPAPLPTTALDLSTRVMAASYPSEIFSPAEVRDLTGCVARSAQVAKLEELGVPFIRDGMRLIISREHVRQRLLGVELRTSSGVRLDLVR